jgi:imidazolonepropionase-like amidohydrolase
MQTHQSEEFALRARVQRPFDVIRAATITAAELMRMEGEIGVIAEGAWADLLVIAGDPLEDLTVLFFIGEYRIADNTRSHFYAAGFTSR